jgi:hypothetical protein
MSVPNTITNVLHALLYEWELLYMRKILKIISDGGDSVSKTCKRGCGGICGGVLASVAVKMF